VADIDAIFFDGRSAARETVRVLLDSGGVRIARRDSSVFWRYGDIRYVAPDANGLPVAFMSAGDGQTEARLLIDDRESAEALAARCPDLADRTAGKHRRRVTFALLSAGVVAVALLAVAAIHYLPRVIAPLIPVSWEVALGDKVVDDIAALFGKLKAGSGKRCEAPAGRAALDRLTARLTKGEKLPYRLKLVVMDIGIVNALATPGGNVVVFRELIKEARSPDEVAGVIAHEMGHVIARHPTQAVARDLGISMIFDTLLGGFGGGIAGNIGQTMLSSAYSRDAEREADAIGRKLLGRAGISTAGIAAFFERLARDAGSMEQAFSYLSSHPPSAERALAARADARDRTTPSMSNADWGAFRAICGPETL